MASVRASGARFAGGSAPVGWQAAGSPRLRRHQALQLGRLEHPRRRPHQVQIGPRLARRPAGRASRSSRGPNPGRSPCRGSRCPTAAPPCRECRPGGFCRGFFQRIEAGHAQDGVDLAAEDDLQHGRRAFGDQHAVALPQGLGPQRLSAHAPQSRQSQPGGVARRPGRPRRCAGSAAGAATAAACGTAATCSCQKAEASATIVQPR